MKKEQKYECKSCGYIFDESEADTLYFYEGDDLQDQCDCCPSCNSEKLKPFPERIINA